MTTLIDSFNPLVFSNKNGKLILEKETGQEKVTFSETSNEDVVQIKTDRGIFYFSKIGEEKFFLVQITL